MNDAHVYEMKMQFVGAKHLGCYKNRTLDTKMSEFVYARLGLDGVQCGYKGLYWFKQKHPYVQWMFLLLMLPCTEVLIVGVTSFREREQIPSLFFGV
jgi:hypothetical protein